MRQCIAWATVLLLVLTGAIAAATTQDDLKNAASREQVAFVLVTQPGATGVDHARGIIHDAMGKVKNSVMIELDRADPGNANLVALHRLSGAPLPLILVFGRTGAIAGGAVAAKATSEQLQKMLPTPKKAEILQALQGGKAVFAVFSRGGMGSAAASACASACGQLKEGAVTIQIDVDDDKELPFLTQLKVDPASKEPVTLVFNKAGQLTGSFKGAPQTTELVQATTKKPSGCCPPGVNSTKSCAPPKKIAGSTA